MNTKIAKIISKQNLLEVVINIPIDADSAQESKQATIDAAQLCLDLQIAENVADFPKIQFTNENGAVLLLLDNTIGHYTTTLKKAQAKTLEYTITLSIQPVLQKEFLQVVRTLTKLLYVEQLQINKA